MRRWARIGVVLVDGEIMLVTDSQNGLDGNVRTGVGRNVNDGRVGREFHDHRNIFLRAHVVVDGILANERRA